MEHPNEGFKRRCVGTELVFIWIPKYCTLTGKRLWLTEAYKQTAMYTGPGDNLFEYRYYNKKEFLLARLKNLI